MTDKPKELKDLRVLVTRPAHQQDNFVNLLTAEGAEAVSFPLLQISPAADPNPALQQLKKAFNSDYIIFVSPNAVRFAHQLMPLPWQGLRAQTAAVGEATARSLAGLNQPSELVPHNAYSGKALLALPDFQDLHGKSVLIVCGDNSRPELKAELQLRGARVRSAVVYQTKLPENAKSALPGIFSQNRPQVICITSNQGILNLKKIMDDCCLDQLLRTPLIVNSERCSKLARESGFSSDITVARIAGDAGQLDALKRWYSTPTINQSE